MYKFIICFILLVPLALTAQFNESLKFEFFLSQSSPSSLYSPLKAVVSLPYSQLSSLGNGRYTEKFDNTAGFGVGLSLKYNRFGFSFLSEYQEFKIKEIWIENVGKRYDDYKLVNFPVHLIFQYYFLDNKRYNASVFANFSSIRNKLLGDHGLSGLKRYKFNFGYGPGIDFSYFFKKGHGIKFSYTYIKSTYALPSAPENNLDINEFRLSYLHIPASMNPERRRVVFGSALHYTISDNVFEPAVGHGFFVDLRLLKKFMFRSQAGYLNENTKTDILSPGTFRLLWFEEMLYMQFETEKERFTPYIGCGIIYGNPEIKIDTRYTDTILKTRYVQYREHIENTFGSSIQLGSRMKITGSLGVDAGVKYIFLKPRVTVAGESISGTVKTYSAKINLNMLLFSLGVTLRF